MIQKIIAVVFFFVSTHLYAKNIHIVTTIKPLESLISNILDTEDSVSSLIDKNNSPHDFYLKPSQIFELNKSDLVILINPDFESFMQKNLAVLPKTTKIITVSHAPNLNLLKTKQYAENVSSHHHNGTDYHLWLSVHNAIQIIHYLKHKLSNINHPKKDIYFENAKNTAKKLLELDMHLKNNLRPAQGKPFMVFHNAYQYFAVSYDLNLIGTITDNPAVYASVNRIKSAQKNLTDKGVLCVFKEPQFSDKIIDTVIKNTQTKIGTLDPLGSSINSGKNHYFDMMNTIVADLLSCLDK